MTTADPPCHFCGHEESNHCPWAAGACFLCDCGCFSPEEGCAAVPRDAAPSDEPACARCGHARDRHGGGGPGECRADECGCGRFLPADTQQRKARHDYMPSANQVRARMCDLCEGKDAHFVPLPLTPGQDSREIMEYLLGLRLYVREGRRYRPADASDAGPRYRKTAGGRYVALAEGE